MIAAPPTSYVVAFSTKSAPETASAVSSSPMIVTTRSVLIEMNLRTSENLQIAQPDGP